MGLLRPGSIRPGTAIGAALGIGILALLAWAFLWPNPLCTTPDCAEPRYHLFIELDSLAGAEPVPLEVTDSGEVRSVAGLFADGGVILDIVRDDSRLPYDDTAGPLDQADLLAYFQAWSSLPRPPGADAKVYALATPTLRSDTGQLVFGMLFDLGAREGVAVAPGVVRRLFRRHNEAQVPLLQMRTFAHELLHALNRYHADGAVSRDGRLTVEAPTNCLALVSPGEWRLMEHPLWALSPSTIGFFQSADARFVLPGAGGSPFEFRRDSVRDCELARRNPLEPDHPRLTLALERLLGLLPQARAQQAEDGPAVANGAADSATDSAAQMEPVAGETRLHLRLEGHAAPWPLGYPAVLRVHARNEGEVPLPLVNRLAPAYGQLVLEVRPAGAGEWRPVHPLVTLETISDERSLLMPGEATSQSIEVYFGQDDGNGWTFPAPGDYELRVRALLAEEEEIAHSEPLPVTVVEPTAPPDVAALALLRIRDEEDDGAGRLDPAVGRFLSFRGRIPGDRVGDRLEQVVTAHPDTALAAAFRFTLAAALLRPAIDPATGRRARADTATARRLLDGVCRDAGIVALARRSWLNHADPDRSQDPAVLAALEAEAWEGRARMEDGLAYGDPALVAAAPPVTFGLGTSALWDRGERELRRLGRRLAREGVSRVLVAGHADGTGTCAVNDALALARARAVAGALVRGGLPRRALTVVGLGARRPLDFATTPEADARNRRVEIFIPAPDPAPTSTEAPSGGS